ncbi:glycoside hydrolase family 43 protein [Serendipita vermifera MAFF 305830]|uniref:Endo-1,5-alpha-L-arabinanase A n=1 Tax=Serendipita vermifera MAFF 305830 TaxID=933852 RepID=A0A0C3APX1_SERVB|nr:glycoside hydrolase family 43 protein [Serendipita vermifera MAFF 305830]
MKFSLPAISIAIVGLLSHAVVAYPNPGAVSGSIDVHDPTICRDSSGKWFLFATASEGLTSLILDSPGISIRTSTDRINWSYVGTVWSSGQATWTDTYTGTSNGNLWAPDCTYKSGTFYLYYSASSFGVNKSAIFFAKSTTGLPGSWSNLGLVTSTTTSNNYNAIDPNLIIGRLEVGRLGSSTGKPSGSTVYSIAQRTGEKAASGAVEAPIIVKNGSYYYLFTSWDICCQGTSSTYNIRVGRATSITGPYVDKSGVALTSGGGTLVLATHDAVYGPGGQHVYQDTDAWVIDYHYYTSSGPKLGINLLDFSSGWPVAY